ncbi:hypothetical protein Bbelb_181220 [Branchiostoma belcheri]|nr:hypothetical protein Bbelb_181220 [Branchiostoma belcheri]
MRNRRLDCHRRMMAEHDFYRRSYVKEDGECEYVNCTRMLVFRSTMSPQKTSPGEHAEYIADRRLHQVQILILPSLAVPSPGPRLEDRETKVSQLVAEPSCLVWVGHVLLVKDFSQSGEECQDKPNELERKVNKHLRRWLGVPPSFTVSSSQPVFSAVIWSGFDRSRWSSQVSPSQDRNIRIADT